MREVVKSGQLDERIAALLSQGRVELEALAKKLNIDSKLLIERARKAYDEAVAEGRKVVNDPEVEKKFKEALAKAEKETKTWTQWALSWIGLGDKKSDK